MLTFRRAVLVSGCILTLFLLFGGSRSDRLSTLESRVRDSERNFENSIREIQQTADQKNSKFENAIDSLQAERKILANEVQGMRKLPDPDASLLHQLAYQYPMNSDLKIPAFVWQTWKHNFEDPELDPAIRKNMETWRTIDVDFVHEVLSDSEAERMVRRLYGQIPKVVEAYVSMPSVILKADFFRYLVLFAKGGVYSDADTELLKPTPNWMPSNINPQKVGLVVGIEADPDRPDWKDWYARRIQFCQWTIEARPGHPILRNIIAEITEKTLERKKDNTLYLGGNGMDSGGDVLEWTGPGIWTDTIFKYLNSNQAGLEEVIDYHYFTQMTDAKHLGDVLILPITSFSPGVGHMGAKAISDPLAFVQHHFEGSWKPANERF